PIAPEAFDDVQIRSTYAGAADPHDNIARAGNLRIRDVLVGDEIRPAEAGVVAGEDCRFHRIATWFFKSFNVAKSGQILRLKLSRYEHRFQSDQILFALYVLKPEQARDELLRIVKRNQALLQENLIAHLERDVARSAGLNRAIG